MENEEELFFNSENNCLDLIKITYIIIYVKS